MSTPKSSFGTANVGWGTCGHRQWQYGVGLGRPVLAKVKTGDVAAVVGNGVNSSNDKAVLIVVNVKTGAVIREIDTGAGSVVPNGLQAAPTQVLGPDLVNHCVCLCRGPIGECMEIRFD
ncbi:MAG: PilC/PilY family type IV pilus protein [Lysobacterales bacterium]